MFRNYLKIAWRNIIRNKVSSIVNIFGLAVGICACVIIYLIVSYELSFDTFHPDNERIYRVMGDVTESTGDKLHFAKVPPPVSIAGRSELSGFEEIAGIIPYNTTVSIPRGNLPAKHFEKGTGGKLSSTVVAEPQYFNIFKYDWLAGHANTALRNPFTVVLVESKARQYFGHGSLDEMIGMQVSYDDSLRVTVSGIVRDWNKNTDLPFTDFISFSTLQSSFLKNRFSTDSWKPGDMFAWVFTKLSRGVTPSQLNAQMTSLVRTHADVEMNLTLWLEPLSNMHFNGDIIENQIRTAHMPTLYSLMGIAFFILILAIINFINLSTAQSFLRAKEVGVRKVLGSNRRRIVFQFLVETLLLTSFSVMLAASLVKPVLDEFRSFIPDGVSFHFLEPSTIIFLVLVTLITSVLAGFYPAMILSSYLPSRNLRGPIAQKGGEKWLLRKGLIVFQFAVSLVFIIGSIVIAKQLRYTREKDLGFTADAIIILETPRGDSLGKIQVLAEKIKQIPGVSNVALQWLSPMTDNPRGMKLKFKSTDAKDFWVTQVAGNEDFIPLYDLELLAGRSIFKSDTVNEFVINETLSRLMGSKNPEGSVGKILYWNDQPYPVVGVVADFHTNSLHEPITPLCVINRRDREGSLAIKMTSTGKQSGMITTAISQMKKAWKQIYPGASFNYRFYDESLAMLYEKDLQTATLINTSMAITIFISCIGLFGLTLFTTEKRAKEISIRKILGAGISNIVILLSKDFVVLVIIALFISSPVAWYIMSQWLQGFAYRIDFSWWIFLYAGTAAILIALITVSFRAVKAAMQNPIKNIRAE